MMCVPAEHESAAATTAGWYPDTALPDVLRYWDGEDWTEQRSSRIPIAKSRRRRVLSIVAGGTLAIGVAAFAVYGLLIYADHDRVDFIDDPAVLAVASKACNNLASELEQADALSGPAEQIAAQSSAVERFVDSIRAVGQQTLDGDAPTIEWLQDWEDLAAAHAAGEEMPVADNGLPIVVRMDQLALDSDLPECAVPQVFLID